MFEGRKFKRMAREAAPGWADEAIELFGYNAEDVIAQQIAHHRYPERYSFEFCLKEIRKRRKADAPPSRWSLRRLIATVRARSVSDRVATVEA